MVYKHAEGRSPHMVYIYVSTCYLFIHAVYKFVYKLMWRDLPSAHAPSGIHLHTLIYTYVCIGVIIYAIVYIGVIMARGDAGHNIYT